MCQTTSDWGVSKVSTTSTIEWHVKAFGPLLGVGCSERQEGREAQGRMAGAERYPEAAVYFQQDILSLKHIRKRTTAKKVAGKGQEEKRPECRYI